MPVQPHLDPLGVLASTRPVVENSRYVRINRGTIESLVPALARGSFEMPEWNERLHFNDGSERTVNWVLALDAVNFSFWSEVRWRVEYQGETYDGYWALAAALKRAVEENFPIYDASYLADLSVADAEQIFRGDGVLPLLVRRVENLQEVGQVLRDHWHGQFSRAVEQASRDAIRLVRLVVDQFPSFGDVADFDGQPVRFYKRAQLLAADLHGIFGGEKWGALRNLDQLTVFADYKIPQVLNRFGILEYTPALDEKIRANFLLPAGSREEVEIRAATVWAGEYLRQAMQAQGVDATAHQIDYFLWSEGQRLSPGGLPYHKTRTIFY